VAIDELGTFLRKLSFSRSRISIIISPAEIEHGNSLNFIDPISRRSPIRISSRNLRIIYVVRAKKRYTIVSFGYVIIFI